MTFEQLNLSAPLLRAVAEAGYTTPSPIQAKAIPPVAAGRDLMGCAQTGTGKTAAFALPMLQRLASHPARKRGAVRALILTPTRELALQIGESFAAYGKYLKLKHTVIFGGVGQAPQVAALQSGVDILIACPGRLNDLIGQGHVKLDDLEIFVLDEADRMLDMGFVHDVKKVIAKLPKVRQNLMFSATMPKEIEELAGSILRQPAFVKVDPPSSTVERIEQTLYYVPDKIAKRALLPHLIETLQVENALVFSRTKHGADRIAKDLCKQGIPAAAIHGNKSQTARVNALEGFKASKTRVLVATDIAARGIDISELAYVFNFDLPEVPETYVHRIGRTARAGADGCAVSFCTPEEREYLAGIEKLNRRQIPVVADHPWQDPTAPAAAAPAKRGPKTKTTETTVPAAAKQPEVTEQNSLRNEESAMEQKEKRPAEGSTGLSGSAKRRRRRRRAAGKNGAEAAVQPAAKAEQAAPQKKAAPQNEPNGKKNQPRRERGAKPEQAKAPQQPKFDPRFLTAGAAQAVRNASAEKQAQPAKAVQNNQNNQPKQQKQGGKNQPVQNAKQQAKPAKQPEQAKQTQPAKAAPAAQPKQNVKVPQPVKAEAAKPQQAKQPARQPEPVKVQQKPKQPVQAKAQPRRTREEDPGLILISRRPPQQKYASFEEYMQAHGGATAPVEDYSNE